MGWSVRRNPPSGEVPPLGRPADEAANLALVNMEIGDCIEVDVSPRAARSRLVRLQVKHQWARTYKVRAWTAYMTRIWRLT
jgi:hypothetical protein